MEEENRSTERREKYAMGIAQWWRRWGKFEFSRRFELIPGNFQRERLAGGTFIEVHRHFSQRRLPSEGKLRHVFIIAFSALDASATAN